MNKWINNSKNSTGSRAHHRFRLPGMQ
jgi:hypothetical protein